MYQPNIMPQMYPPPYNYSPYTQQQQPYPQQPYQQPYQQTSPLKNPSQA